MDISEIKLECLKLAIETDAQIESIVELAEQFYEFIIASETATP